MMGWQTTDCGLRRWTERWPPGGTGYVSPHLQWKACKLVYLFQTCKLNRDQRKGIAEKNKQINKAFRRNKSKSSCDCCSIFFLLASIFFYLIDILRAHFNLQRHLASDVTTESCSHWRSLHLNFNVSNLCISRHHYADFSVRQSLPWFTVYTTLDFLILLKRGITKAIMIRKINSYEGKKKKDLTWRSLMGSVVCCLL